MKRVAYRKYLLAVLLIILAFNYVDRSVLGLLLQDIKVDLNLSDTQLGFLSGISFALFYSIMGVPIARWADRGNRVTIIASSTAIWSVAVALCGVAWSFLLLVLIRVGVAVGEAGCIPPAHSLIADYFNRQERPRAVAIYMLGGPVSIVIGYCLAGWLNEVYGWRMTFMLLGLPGLGLAGLARFSLREPRLEQAVNSGALSFSLPSRRGSQAELSAHPSLRTTAAALWANKTFRHLLLFFSVSSFFGQGIGQWQATFMIRSYGLHTGELGTWFAGIWGLGGLVGTYLGGVWPSRIALHDERLQLKIMTGLFCGFGVVSALVYLSPNPYGAFGLLAVAAVGSTATIAPFFAMIQTLIPERMRATSIAVVYLSANLIGMGLGPLAAGSLSDTLQPLFGENSLRFALLALCPGYLWGGWHLWRARRTVTHDLRFA